MFRRKQDVDRHVSSILGRIKEERERNAKGYQIARLYFEVGEYETARRYLASFLSVRETVPQAYRLLGQIEEAVGNKENAVEAYKRFLEFGGSGKEVVLRICELYCDIGVDPGKGKYWLEKAEQQFPQSDIVFRLKEKLLAAAQGPSNDEELEQLISSELVKKPQDVKLRIKLLRCYLASDRFEQAYTNAVETDRTTAFASSLEWYECLLEVFRAYQVSKDTSSDFVYTFHYLVVLNNLTYLRLCHKDVVESAEGLHLFDLAVQSAVKMTSPNEEWDALIAEMQGQLFFLAGTLLLKRAQKGSFMWNDVRPLAAVFYLLCQTIPTIDAQATWFVRPSHEREKMYAWMYKNSFFRISQSGHSLYQLCQGDPATWAQRLQQQCCSPVGQEKVFKVVFTMREMWARSDESYLMNTHKYCNTTLNMPPRWQLYDVDRVAHTFHPESLSELVWLCLQQYSFGDPHQPDYNFKTFETLQYSVKNMENGATETLCQLDTEAFLYATVRCAALQVKEQQVAVDGDITRPSMLPLCLCKKLCTPDQEQWWQTAYSFYSNSIKDNFSKMRHILQRGLEVVRLVSVNHGMSTAMVVHLAKTFDAKVKSLKDGNHGIRGSTNQLACLEARAAFYWKHALTMLTRLEKNQRGPRPKMRMFDDGDDADQTLVAVQELLQDAKFASAVIAMREGRYEEAIKGFEKLTTPWASFYRAQIYKALAQQELEGGGKEESKRQKYTALIGQAREALYLTMDHLGGDKNHVKNENGDLDDMEDSALRTPVRHQNGHHDDVSHTHSTPNPTSSKSVRQRLIMSELTSDSPLPPQRTAGSSPSTHTRPSPERLDAQIKSINYSQSQLFKTVLDRNEELIVMYRSVVDELQESNRQLKAALGENTTLMEQLKRALTENRDMVQSLHKELTDTKETVKQMKGLAAQHMAPGYLVGSPYQQQYPPYAAQPPPHLVPPGTNYRYPLLSAYPATRPTQPTSVRLSERPGGTAPSSFGKFRPEQPEAAHVISEWLQPGAAVAYSPQSQAAIPQPGYFASALRGQALQYAPATTATPATSLLMPGPGFFSVTPQQIPVIGAGAAKAPQAIQPITQVRPSEPASGVVQLFLGEAKLTTTAGETPCVEVRVIQDTDSKQGSIAVMKKGTQEVIANHNIAGIKVITSFTPNYFLWSIVSQSPEKRLDETFRVSFDNAELPKRMRAAVEKVIKDTGLEPQPSPVITSPAFAARSPGQIAAVSTPEYAEVAAYSQPAKPEVAAYSHPAKPEVAAYSQPAKPEVAEYSQPAKPEVAAYSQPAKPEVAAYSQPAKPEVAAYSQPAKPEAVVSTPGLSVRAPQGMASTAVPATGTPTSTTPAAGPKTVFGGFTFSGTPVVKSGETSKEEKPKASPQFRLKESAIKPAASAFGTAAPTTVASGTATSGQTFVFGQASPASSLTFSGLSTGQSTTEAFKSSPAGFTPSSQPMFQKAGSPVKSPGGKDDEAVEEYEPNVDFKPVIELPELVEVFAERVKLFRFDSDLNQWKERGIGELKILQLKGAPRFRVLMRREQVLKVCANHYISSDMKLTPLSASDRAWCYTASDYAEEEVKIEKFAVKFKNPEKAQEFKTVFEDCQRKLLAAEQGGAKAKTPEKAKDQPDGGQQKSLSEMFKPAEGSWECPGCLCRNNASVLRCPACQTVKPGAKPEDVKPAPAANPFASVGGGGFGGFKMGGAGEGDKNASAAGGVKPAATKCPACQTLKPGVKPEDVKAASVQSAPSGENPFAVTSGGAFGGFKLGATAAAGDKATPPAGGFKFGGQPLQKTGDTTSAPVAAGGGGFKFTLGDGSGFKFGTPATAAPSTGFVFGIQARLGQVTSPTSQAGAEAEKKDKGFQFTFSLTPQKSTPQKSQQQMPPPSPLSPQEGEDSHIYFEPVVQLPDKVQVVTGEENETILFENRAKLYRFVGGEWKERGLGVFKILQHKETGRIRVLMRRDQVLKICCNHYITPELDLKPMPRSDGKAWIWYAMDFSESEGKMEQLAIRFRDAEIANNFKQVFDESREKMRTPSKVSAASSDPNQASARYTSPDAAAAASRKLFTDDGNDDDVIFLHEEKPTPEQIERARKLMLPDTFYLYENRPGCPGCIGCEDFNPSRSPAAHAQKEKPKAKAPEPKQEPHLPVQESMAKSTEGMMFGNAGGGLSFSALAASSTDDSAFGGSKDPSKPFHWSGAGQKLFGASPRGEGQGGGGDDDEVPPSNDIHFEPVIPLPELVKVQTGEEDWEPLFSQRAKVYRFDGTQWKERGIGEMKIMKHKEKLLFRVLQRREQVLKVAL
ncbi:hypothetical protein BaRGS_00023298 [Batillaria attramentaria]|uniref:E3 SUMO-protein ligase RanBP2 n=1 Tax=Batillaria attramentaria TaxID=370345 RepID=A0ABD0KEE6_9CAEN